MMTPAEYGTDLTGRGDLPLPVTVLESDVDLYWDMALRMHRAVREHNARGERTVFILPVGPVFQYRRFVRLCRQEPIDLSATHCFFMDEYMRNERELIPASDPLSFRGFIERELVEAMPEEMGLRPERIRFPDPKDPAATDRSLEDLGGPDLCIAGVGINGHVAFNEPPEPPAREGSADAHGAEGAPAAPGGMSPDGTPAGMSAEAFRELGTRVLRLSRETITINSNTALRGAMDYVPRFAVTIGMRQILSSREIRVYLNRPWQSAVVRRLLFEEAGSHFPVTLLRDHGDVELFLTELVAQKPDFALK